MSYDDTLFAADNKQLKLKELIEFIENRIKKQSKLITEFIKEPVSYPNFSSYGMPQEARYAALHSKAGLILSFDAPLFPIVDGDDKPITLKKDDVLTVGELLKFIKTAPDTNVPVSTLVQFNVDPDPSRILRTNWGLSISSQ